MAATSEMWPRCPDTPKYVCVGKLGCREQLLQNLHRAALVRRDSGLAGIPAHSNHLHRQGAKIHAQVTLCTPPGDRLFLRGGDVRLNT